MAPKTAIIVGAGMSGLVCARELTARQVAVTVLEASDAVGGRVRTDAVDGFLLDRGFQVLLTAYPEVQRSLDVASLELQPFAKGAKVFFGGRFHTVQDPRENPGRALQTALSRVGSLADKLRVLRLLGKVKRGSVEELFLRPETSSQQRLQELGFSEEMIARFFRPFFGGVFLEPNLETSSRMLEFIFRCFADAPVGVPRRGMRAIPEQLAAKLPAGTVRLGRAVRHAEAKRVTLDDGMELDADAVVIATDGVEAARMTPGITRPDQRDTATLYFAASAPPAQGAFLMLDGEASGPVNHLAVLSEVSTSYAPAGQALISASVISPRALTDTLEQDVRAQLTRWFGESVNGWRHLRTDRIPHALPVLPSVVPVGLPVRLESGVFVCGDHREHPSLQGAMRSGRRAAEALVEAIR